MIRIDGTEPGCWLARLRSDDELQRLGRVPAEAAVFGKGGRGRGVRGCHAGGDGG